MQISLYCTAEYSLNYPYSMGMKEQQRTHTTPPHDDPPLHFSLQLCKAAQTELLSFWHALLKKLSL